MSRCLLSNVVACGLVAVLVLPAVNASDRLAETTVDGELVNTALDFLIAHDMELNAEQSAELAELAALPGPIQASLSQVIRAFQAFELASADGLGLMTVEGPSSLDADSVVIADDSAIAAARDTLLGAIAGLQPSLTAPTTMSSPPTFVQVDLNITRQNIRSDTGQDIVFLENVVLHEFFKVLVHPNFNNLSGSDAFYEHRSEVCVGVPPEVEEFAHFDLSPVLNIDLRKMNNVYTADFALSIDTCGDDFYFNNAGGNNLQGGRCTLTGLRVAAALVDLGGDDTYGNASAPRFCGQNGGAFRGAGFLFDASGDDRYIAGGFAANGGGSQGSGFVLDLEGGDHYVAGAFATNGGCDLIGRGSIIDFAGDDEYRGTIGGVNGGGGAGCATLLFDGQGDDSYSAIVAAVNGGAAIGALALLLDLHGHDVYSALDGGAGTDVTVVPKGLVGAQIDL